MPEPDPIANLKQQLREQTLAARDAVSPEQRQAAAQAIADRPFPLPVEPGVVISGFMPLNSEINSLPLMRKLAGLGARLALPVVQGRGKPLTMRAYVLGDLLDTGQWGIREPKPEAPEVFPDILLVPLSVFDRRGNRIGYGAGYYDMTMARLRAMKPVRTIGLAYAMQQVPSVPATERDERLDLVLTEREAIDCRGA